MHKFIKLFSITIVFSLLSACQTPLSECVEEHTKYIPIKEYDPRIQREKIVDHKFHTDITSSILCTLKAPKNKK